MILRTPRLLLRDFSLQDLPAVAAYRDDPRYQKFYPEIADVAADSRELLERFIGWSEERPRCRYQLAITLLPSGEVVGNVGLRAESAGSEVAEMGVELSPTHWGRGYATEAARALLEHGFSELALRRVHAHCVTENEGSARVLERLGMRKQGVLPRHERFRDRWWDVSLYAIVVR